MEILGLDIGGSGIKGAIVNVITGRLVSERHSIPTPTPSTPNRMAKVVAELVHHFNWNGPVGCSFPTVVIDGNCKTAGNISPDWVGVQIDALFSNHCNNLNFYVANDADLAGLAEMSFGTGKNKAGKVIVVTIGTGLGSGIFYDGQLIPNFELGRMFHTNGEPIEFFASGAAKRKEDLRLKDWAERFDFFLKHVARICSPDHFIIGGGLSDRFNEFYTDLTVNVPVEVAYYKNDAGIVGAAMYAYQNLSKSRSL